MPYKPKRPCNHPGCPALAHERYCPAHKTKHEQSRGSATERGYSSRWRKARLLFLREHPLCECDECTTSGVIVAAEVVDHTIPHKGNYELFWDETNWRAMSKRHHDIKTATEDGGFGR